MMHRRDFLQLSGMAAIQVVAPRGAASQEANRLADIEALVNAKMAEYHVPGVALGIVKAGRLETRVFGITSVESPQPITVDTVFPIMSITKTVGATADPDQPRRRLAVGSARRAGHPGHLREAGLVPRTGDRG